MAEHGELRQFVLATLDEGPRGGWITAFGLALIRNSGDGHLEDAREPTTKEVAAMRQCCERLTYLGGPVERMPTGVRRGRWQYRRTAF